MRVNFKLRAILRERESSPVMRFHDSALKQGKTTIYYRFHIL